MLRPPPKRHVCRALIKVRNDICSLYKLADFRDETLFVILRPKSGTWAALGSGFHALTQAALLPVDVDRNLLSDCFSHLSPIPKHTCIS